MTAEPSTHAASVVQALTLRRASDCAISRSCSQVKGVLAFVTPHGKLTRSWKGIVQSLAMNWKRFREQLGHGVHEGGGLLGRVAEFLVGQRGH